MKRKKPPSEAPPPKSGDVPLSDLAPWMGVVPHAAPSDNFLIAALGASAGGLEAFEKFFKHMAPDADIGFVIVQHLAPDHASALADLLGRHTQMAVAEVRDNTKVVPNRVYIIPPNATLTIKDCTLRVAEPVEPRGQRAPIDSLFSSLAVYFSGRVSRYLEQPPGTPESNVVNMAREGIRIPLRTSLHRAVSAHERAVQNQVSIQMNGEVSRIDLTVEPLTEFQDANLYMIVFEEVTPNSNPQPGESPAFAAGSEEIIRHLESELRSAQEHAQAAFEELETSNEELQSANEEYQSTNEELETSKEELQSFNEELETVNSELNRKVTELDAANSDLQNLLNGTQIATIFLDTELHIRNFTPAAGSMFRLITGDVGRPITDLAAQFTDVDLMQDTRDVLATLSARERQVAGAGGRHYQRRILPYRTVHNVIAGVVLTFVDVTALKQAEQLATEAQDYAMSIVDTVREPLVVLDDKLRVKSASKAFFDKFAVSAEETLWRSLYDLGDRQWDIPDLRKLLAEVLPESKKIEDYEVEHEFAKLGRRTMLLNGRRVEQRDGKEPLLLLAIEDVTERKRAEETLRTHAEELSRLARGTVGRELRMIEMKKEVNELCHRLGEEVRYPLEFEQDGKESPDSPQPRNQP